MFNKKNFVSINFTLLINFAPFHGSRLMLKLEAAHNKGTIKNGVTWTLTDPPSLPQPPF